MAATSTAARRTAGFGGLAKAEAAELVGRVQAGDSDALGELYRHGRARVRHYLMTRMPFADVEDVVQETFLRAPEMARGFNPQSEVGAWLCGAVAQQALVDYGRRDRYRPAAVAEAMREAALVEPAPVEPAPDDDTAAEREATPLSERMTEALAGLTRSQRRAMQLRFLDEMTPEQAAKAAGTSAAAIVTACSTARKQLRTELADLVPDTAASVDPAMAGLTKKDAVRAALQETGADVPAAVAWLSERGVAVDPSYAYGVRNGRKVTEKKTEKARWPQPKREKARTAAEEFAAANGTLPTAARLAELTGVSCATAATALSEIRAQTEQHDDVPAVADGIPTPRTSGERLAEQVRQSGAAVHAAEEAVTHGAADEDQQRAERLARWKAEDQADEAARADDLELAS